MAATERTKTRETAANATPATGIVTASPRVASPAAARIEDRLEVLTDLQRTVLALHHVEGLSHDEIAQVLQLSPALVARFHREALEVLSPASDRQSGAHASISVPPTYSGSETMYAQSPAGPASFICGLFSSL